MRRASFIMLAALIALLAAGAARSARVLPDDSFELASGGHQGLRLSAQTALLRMLERGKRREERKEDEEEMRAYTTIKFIVPPHKADKFEEVWLDLDEDVQDEKDNDIHTLKSQALDNYVYHSYAEWSTLHGLHKHLTSRHFEKFSDWVDDNEVVWFLEVLKNESEDIEEDMRAQRKRKVSELSDAALAMAPNHDKDTLRQVYGELTRRKDMVHMMVKFHVPPGMDQSFVEEWNDHAESVIKEKGNRIYSLRKVASDNVHWYGYSTFDSHSDFMYHWESKHVQRFKDFMDKNDITWSLEFLENIGGEKAKRL